MPLQTFPTVLPPVQAQESVEPIVPESATEERKKEESAFYFQEEELKKNAENLQKDLNVLREKVRAELNNLRVSQEAPKINRAVKFTAYFSAWLETVKRPHVAEETYSDYLRIYNVHIRPHLESLKVTEIRQFDCQKIINDLQAEGKNRTAKKVYMGSALSRHFFDFTKIIL